MDSLIQVDQAIFHFVHVELTNAIFDWLLPIWRNKLTWLPFYIVLIGILLYNFGKQGLWICLLTVATVSVCDYTSSSIFKPLINRTRPCNTEALQSYVIARVDCGSGKSFPSSHATNHFGISVFLILVFRYIKTRWKIALLFWAGLIALAQVYVGVHYPLDVIAGGLLGSLIAGIVYMASGKIFPSIFQFDKSV